MARAKLSSSLREKAYARQKGRVQSFASDAKMRRMRKLYARIVVVAAQKPKPSISALQGIDAFALLKKLGISDESGQVTEAYR